MVETAYLKSKNHIMLSKEKQQYISHKEHQTTMKR